MTQVIETRNADLSDLATLLADQQAAKVDMVVPLSTLTSTTGVIKVKGTGVFAENDQQLLPTAIADGQLAGKLGIPVQYLRALRAERPDLYDANVNGWTQGYTETRDPSDENWMQRPVVGPFEPDNRLVMLRTFQGDVGEMGVLRAILSDRYGIIDNFDVLTAVLSGIAETGTDVTVVGCDLTETRMTVRLLAPDIMVNAPDLLKGYRSPFGEGGVYDHSGGRRTFHKGTLPQHIKDKYGVNDDGVFAGLVITNSETGGGAFTIVPRLTVLQCTNGLMMTKDAMRQVHLGGKLAEGTINWSDDTQKKNLDLITAQARDAVAAFLSPEYAIKAVGDLSKAAQTELTDPTKTIEVVAKTLLFSDDTRKGILDHFIKGGQVTAGGVMQAITSYAQTVESADLAFDLESQAVKALELAAA